MTNAEVTDGQDVVTTILHKGQQFGQKAVGAWHEGKHALAIDLMRSAISVHPDVPVYHANLAMMLKDAAPIEDRIIKGVCPQWHYLKRKRPP